MMEIVDDGMRIESELLNKINFRWLSIYLIWIHIGLIVAIDNRHRVWNILNDNMHGFDVTIDIGPMIQFRWVQWTRTRFKRQKKSKCALLNICFLMPCRQLEFKMKCRLGNYCLLQNQHLSLIHNDFIKAERQRYEWRIRAWVKSELICILIVCRWILEEK